MPNIPTRGEVEPIPSTIWISGKMVPKKGPGVCVKLLGFVARLPLGSRTFVVIGADLPQPCVASRRPIQGEPNAQVPTVSSLRHCTKVLRPDEPIWMSDLLSWYLLMPGVSGRSKGIAKPFWGSPQGRCAYWLKPI